MERRTFLRNSLLTAGGILLGGAAIFRFLKDGKMEGPLRPATIETGKRPEFIWQAVVRDVKILPAKSHLNTLKMPIKWDWSYNI